MKSNRRNFIKTASLGSLGFGLLPHFTPFPQEFLWDSIFNENYPKMSFPRKSPESQGISSKGISDFIKAANVSGLEWHSFMLLRHGNVVAEGWGGNLFNRILNIPYIPFLKVLPALQLVCW